MVDIKLVNLYICEHILNMIAMFAAQWLMQGPYRFQKYMMDTYVKILPFFLCSPIIIRDLD